MPVIDLKSQIANSNTLPTTRRYWNHVHRQTLFFSNHRLSSHTLIQTMRGTISGKLQSKNLLLSRSISLHVFRSAQIPRKSQRYRSLSQNPTKQALSHGNSFENRSKHPGQCTQNPRLTNLRRMKYFDEATGTMLVFLTNNTSLPATRIAELFRCR